MCCLEQVRNSCGQLVFLPTEGPGPGTAVAGNAASPRARANSGGASGSGKNIDGGGLLGGSVRIGQSTSSSSSPKGNSGNNRLHSSTPVVRPHLLFGGPNSTISPRNNTGGQIPSSWQENKPVRINQVEPPTVDSDLIHLM